jgi:hypothetical protein
LGSKENLIYERHFMKPASSSLIDLMNTFRSNIGGSACFWELYTFALAGGSNLYYTTSDFDIFLTGVTFVSKGPRFDTNGQRALGHWKIGLDVDRWSFSVFPRAQDDITGATFPDLIGNTPWLAAARAGALDGSAVTVQRAFFSAPGPTYPIPPAGAVPIGAITIFSGLLMDVSVSTSEVFCDVGDLRQLLSINMPRNYYQPACRHTLFDTGCTLSAAAFAKNGSVLAGSTQISILATLSAPTGFGTYTLGRILMTSGKNEGLQRTISNWDGAKTLALINPFNYAVSAGDTFTIFPGCNKTLATCEAVNNKENFGGFPFIPPPEQVM